MEPYSDSSYSVSPGDLCESCRERAEFDRFLREYEHRLLLAMGNLYGYDLSDTDKAWRERVPVEWAERFEGTISRLRQDLAMVRAVASQGKEMGVLGE